MRFEWDDAKNQENRRKDGLDFADAPLVFGGRTLTFEDLRQPYDEPRYLPVGTLAGRMVIIAHTLRGDANHFHEEGQGPRKSAVSTRFDKDR